VLQHKPYYLEVAITSPYTKISTSRSVPYFARERICYEGADLLKKCQEMLIEIYTVAAHGNVDD
jgi:hypothetical protein